MAPGHTVGDIGEVGFGIELVEFCALENRIEHGGTFSSGMGAEEQEVFPGDSDTAQ
jgi:hypothetical protein